LFNPATHTYRESYLPGVDRRSILKFGTISWLNLKAKLFSFKLIDKDNFVITYSLGTIVVQGKLLSLPKSNEKYYRVKKPLKQK